MRGSAKDWALGSAESAHCPAWSHTRNAERAGVNDPAVARKRAGCTRARAASCLAWIVSSKSHLGHAEPVARRCSRKSSSGSFRLTHTALVGIGLLWPARLELALVEGVTRE